MLSTPNRYPRRPKDKPPLTTGDWIVFATFVGAIALVAWFLTASSACLWPAH